MKIEEAIDILKSSERGRWVGKRLLLMLDEGGLGLDQNGQIAIMDLLDSAWCLGKAGSVLWSLDEAFGREEQ